MQEGGVERCEPVGPSARRNLPASRAENKARADFISGQRTAGQAEPAAGAPCGLPAVRAAGAPTGRGGLERLQGGRHQALTRRWRGAGTRPSPRPRRSCRRRTRRRSAGGAPCRPRWRPRRPRRPTVVSGVITANRRPPRWPALSSIRMRSRIARAIAAMRCGAGGPRAAGTEPTTSTITSDSGRS